jgi:hypothetical protein
MATDRFPALDGDGARFDVAAQQLADNEYAVKHQLLKSGTSATAIDPASEGKQDTGNTRIGDLTETAPASDTASSGLNGRLQRIAQRITSLIALLPSALGAGGGLKVDGSGTALPVSAAALPLPSGAATEATLATHLTISDFDTKVGSLTETAPASDTASSGLNGRLQRIAQRITSLIALLPSALGAGGGLKVDGSGTALPVSAAALPLPSGAATEATLTTLLTISDFDTKVGSLTETAPASDTASSGLNGRLQRIAQRITSLIALLPSALGAGGGLKVDGSGTALPVSEVKSTTIGTATDVALNNGSLTGVLTLDAARRTAMITSLASNTAEIRIGEAGVNATRGTPIYPGQTITIDTTAAISAFVAAASQSVAVLVVKD